MSSHGLFPTPYAPAPTEVLLEGLPDELRVHASALLADIASAYKQRRDALPIFGRLSPSEAAPFAPAARLLQGRYGSLQERVGQHVLRTLHEQQERDEHAAVARIAEAVQVAGKRHLRWNETDIRDAAEVLAERCNTPAWGDEQILRVSQHWLGVPFEVPGKTAKAKRARLQTPRWWRRTIRRIIMRAVENAHLLAGMVGRGRMKYASNHAVRVRQQNLARQDEWLKNTTAERVDAATGEVICKPLPTREAATKAKLAEFWAWCAGVQALAQADGLEMAMLTLTLEPSFHPAPAIGKTSWDGTTPDLANREIGRRWAQIRASLAKQDITLSGFRAAEPHGDGCPHWHLFLIYRPDIRATVLAETLKVFPGKIALRIRDHQGEDHRCIFGDPEDALTGTWRPALGNEGTQAELAVINTAHASIAAYVTKYVIKQSEDDRAGAWRSTWGIRGIQWFGIRSALTKWRELRRLSTAPPGELASSLWQAATTKDAAAFLRLLGGLAAGGGKTAPSQPLMAHTRTAYGEDGARLVGYLLGGEPAITRPHEWKLMTHRPPPAPTVTVKQIYPSKPKNPVEGEHNRPRPEGRVPKKAVNRRQKVVKRVDKGKAVFPMSKKCPI
ncbi:replication endonuclease [Thiobacillus sedimenti]|uniref:Replication endonuclease n=1 Tax=Thiobacillus sedimenti TaxID=3110231 RepID=A0ABZ1CL59_9PROT|nr:replication endonuclease [Thiobacillus sp. SCUT-2]WRS40011.1 replication endonuclease [Thiobacillus sp. SCUT-2]